MDTKSESAECESNDDSIHRINRESCKVLMPERMNDGISKEKPGRAVDSIRSDPIHRHARCPYTIGNSPLEAYMLIYMHADDA